jgi:N-acyl-D-amino-acid deacylase
MRAMASHGLGRSLAAALLLVAAAAPPVRAEPTGAALPGLEPYDEVMTALLRKWDVPGAGLALAREGKLLLVRGYGLANKEQRIPVEPASLFRIGSLSKTVTAVAVLQLVQDGKLSLDDKLVPLLGDAGPRPGKVSDPRVHDITVRHLLQHSGGFDRQRSGDAVFMPRAVDAARRQGGSLPPDCPTVMRDALEHKLDFAPGTRIAYSNIGYCILGRVVERVGGRPYEAHVSARILAPAGAARMRVGRTLVAAEREVTYYDYEVKPVKGLPGLGLTTATRPYGEFAVETMDSYGGWIAAPVDYLRFLLAIDGRHGTALLDAATLAQMNGRSGLPETSAGVEEGNVCAPPTASPGSSSSTAGRRTAPRSVKRSIAVSGRPNGR